MSGGELGELCKALPKVELHAHLNGCIRDATLRELAERSGQEEALRGDVHKLTAKGDRTLAECFQLFDVIHRIATDHDALSRMTLEALQDMQADGVIYAELRTTPKERLALGMTKESYVEAVLKGMRRYRAQLPDREAGVEARLLLSIDRRECAEAAMATARLAAALAPQGEVVGLDLSGNPAVGSWTTWLPALQRARAAGLRLTVHAAELWRPEETVQILELRPDRLGHMCCLDHALRQSLLESRVPLELCLTSNVKTQSVHDYECHHFRDLFRDGHPIALCTDDPGVFSCTLSGEFLAAATAFQLSADELWQLAERAIDYSFADDATKNLLKRRFHLQRQAALARQHRSPNGTAPEGTFDPLAS